MGCQLRASKKANVYRNGTGRDNKTDKVTISQSSAVFPSFVHQFSIDTPSKLWSIFEGRTDLKHREIPLLSALKTKCLKVERRGS